MAALALTTEPYTIFLSGSILEGYGNADSDLDVFVVYPEAIPSLRSDFNMGKNLISMECTANWRLDVESWAKEQVLSLAQSLRHCSSDDGSECFTFSIDDIDFAHRIRVGVPIQHHEHFQQLYQTFDFDQLSRVIMERNLIWYNGAQEDAAGAITSKQHGTALLTARQAVQLAIDILLASHGETNTRSKWRFFKLEKLGDPVLLEHYWELETPKINTRDDVLEYAKQCIAFASQLVLKAQKARS